MAAFSISYEGLTRGNIRHIYSYKRSPAFVPSPRPYGKTTQFLPQPLTERYPPRFFDYYPAFDIGLPRAPAFDRLTCGEIRSMVDRMQKPIFCQRERGKTKRSKAGGQQERSRPPRGQDKVVRFQSPEPRASSGEEREDVSAQKAEAPLPAPPTVSQQADSDSSSDHKVVEEKGEIGVKDSSSVKVKGEELPELGDKKRDKQKKHKKNEKNSKNVKYSGFLPPINN